MASFKDDFIGISADPGEAQGSDPNFRNGYGGMRMTGRDGRAAYGAHRIRRAADPRGWVGENRIVAGSEPIRLGRSGESAAASGLARRRKGVRDTVTRPSEEMARRRTELMRRRRPGYSNRGLSEGGFSERKSSSPLRRG